MANYCRVKGNKVGYEITYSGGTEDGHCRRFPRAYLIYLVLPRCSLVKLTLARVGIGSQLEGSCVHSVKEMGLGSVNEREGYGIRRI